MFNSRDEALELVENGVVTAESMLTMCLKYMSTDDVADMLDCNELSSRFQEDDEDEDEYEDDGQPSMYEEYQDLYGGDDAYEGDYI
jgi:hypothetical protein